MIRNHIGKALKRRRRELHQRRKQRNQRQPLLEQLERRDLLAVTIDGMQLINDSGLSDTDRVTSDPSVSATVNGMFTGSYVQVEFDHYADGYVDGSANVNMPGEQFNYDPRMVDGSLNGYAGLFTLRYRSVEFDSQNNVVGTGSWADFVLTLEQPANPEIDLVDSWSVSVADGVGSVNFGSTDVGVPLSQTFSVYNWGIDALTIDTASFSLPSGFTLTAVPAASVAPYGGQASFTVQLDATNPGTFSGTLSFVNDDQDENPYDFTITGDVIGQGAEIEVLLPDSTVVLDGSGSVDLGNTNVDQVKSQSFTIKNWGSADLTIDTASISVPTGYSIVTTPAATVSGGGGETTLVIQLDATTAGTFSGTVSL